MRTVSIIHRGESGSRKACAPLQNRTLLHSQHFQYDQHFCFQFRVFSSACSWKSLVTSPPSRYIYCSSASRSLAIRLSAWYPATYPTPNRKVRSDKNSGMKKLLGEKFANSFQSSAKLISLTLGMNAFKSSIVCISVIYNWTEERPWSDFNCRMTLFLHNDTHNGNTASRRASTHIRGLIHIWGRHCYHTSWSLG